ncbi:MAG: Gfo/Idh/MocA family oxidoreductase [Planctomycetes bacterium]|nr:Gfo/Idh/MocA family oxidoreductase [Planctomycetota bacterium]
MIAAGGAFGNDLAAAIARRRQHRTMARRRRAARQLEDESMARIDRRTFLKGSLAAAGAAFVVSHAGHRVLGASERVRVGVAGVHGRGSGHIGEYLKMADVDLCWIIDVDNKVLQAAVARVAKDRGSKPDGTQDVRKALDDKSLDAISIATPNHWHTLMTVWAVQAGKDVYVEKPATHTLVEGRIASEIIARSKQIVQTGTQRRSEATWARMVELTKSGQLGKLLISHGYASKTRNSIGFKEPKDPPPELAWDIWVGPGPMQPYHENLVHYNWHWFWDFGSGEIGNQGVHQTDVARWAIPGAAHARGVFSIGGRFGYEDQGQTPNTQLTVYDYGDTLMVFEVCGLVGARRAAKAGKDAPAEKEGAGEAAGPAESKVARVSNDFVYEAGTVVDGRTFYPKGKTDPAPLPKVDAKLGPGSGNFRNFIEAVRSRRKEDLNAPFLEGHYSAAICHLGNISYRLGKDVQWKEVARNPFGKDDYANAAWDRLQEHLAKNRGLKLADMKCRVGRALNFDGAKEKFIGCPEADAMLTRPPRPPFVITEKA